MFSGGSNVVPASSEEIAKAIEEAQNRMKASHLTDSSSSVSYLVSQLIIYLLKSMVREKVRENQICSKSGKSQRISFLIRGF